jgi:hypothetical protein
MSLHRLTHNGRQGSAFIGSHNQELRLLAYKSLNLSDLLAVVLLRVGDDKSDVGIGGKKFRHQGVLSGAIGFGVVALAEGDKKLLPQFSTPIIWRVAGKCGEQEKRNTTDPD